jgi:hypothetical protein
MTARLPAALRICPDCGARSPTASNRCWLCGKPVEQLAIVGTQSEAAARSRAVERSSFAATGMLTITLAAVLLGVALISPGMGIVLAVAVTPAFVRTCLVTARRRARGEEVSLTHKLGSFGLSFAVTLGLLILIAHIVVVAIVAALFVICWAAMAGGL